MAMLPKFNRHRVLLEMVVILARHYPLLVVAAAIMMTLVYVGIARDSLTFWHWGDEDEKIVAAWMIAEGGRLYDDILGARCCADGSSGCWLAACSVCWSPC
jgi:hypothetical protein